MKAKSILLELYNSNTRQDHVVRNLYDKHGSKEYRNTVVVPGAVLMAPYSSYVDPTIIPNLHVLIPTVTQLVD